MKIELTEKENIVVGDAIVFNGKIVTVSKKDINKDTFMGTCIFGDSYKLGNKKVEKVIFNEKTK